MLFQNHMNGISGRDQIPVDEEKFLREVEQVTVYSDRLEFLFSSFIL